jgi:hypothetical protein
VSGTCRGKNVVNGQGWGESKVLSFINNFLKNRKHFCQDMGLWHRRKQVMVKVKIQNFETGKSIRGTEHM